MEVNSADTFLDVLSKLAFADLVQPEVIRECASLMELTEKFIYFEGAVVEDELVPESALLDGADLLVVTDDLLEVPGECEHISMLLLIECHVDTELSVFLIEINSALLLLLDFDLSGVESAGNGLTLQ